MTGEELERIKRDEAENALKMRTPKKPIFSGDGYWDGKLVFDMANCPTCGYLYEYGWENWGYPFCPKCGQAIDWLWDEEEAE